MTKDELIQEIKKQGLGDLEKIIEGHDQVLITLGTDKEESSAVSITGSCSPDFIANVIDTILSDNPKVLKALAFRKICSLSDFIEKSQKEEISLDDVIEEIQALRESKKTKTLN